MHQFRQVDVFGSGPLTGNPVAVVHDADDLDDTQMQQFAQWTNLSETTFLLAPTTDAADYRLRIFTPSRELPFAGHPTLGSAHAWLEAGGTPRQPEIVQECGAGLVTIERGEHLAFRAPPLLRDGPVSDEDLDQVVEALGITREDVVDAKWVDNGPGWVGVLLDDAHEVLALNPDREKLGDLDVGVVGPWRDGGSDARSRCGRSTDRPRIRSPAASTPASASGWPAPASPSSTSPRRAPPSVAVAGCT